MLSVTFSLNDLLHAVPQVTHMDEETIPKIDPEEVAAAEKKRPNKAPRGKRGRPTKLTPELTDQICRVIEAGNYIETAARYCGVDKRSLFAWMQRGNEQKAKRRRGIHRDFLHAVEKALAAAEARSVARIVKAGENQWQAEAWRLERKHPKRWGRKNHLTAEVRSNASLTELINASFAKPGDEDDELTENETNVVEVFEED